MLKYLSAKLLGIILFGSVFLLSFSAFSIERFNVRSFNATGDGKTDDILAFERCAVAAIKAKNAEIVIPYGLYRISRPWVLAFTKETIGIVGLKNANGSIPTIFINTINDVVRVKGFLFSRSGGVIRISNLNLIGSNPSYNSTHPNINQDKWYCGLAVTDKKEAIVSNVHIKNVYGEGIYIADTKQNGIPKTARFANIEIKNCSVRDVWGYNPANDDYGDGIYISNVARGLLQNNEVYNNTKTTKQLGRAGIVLEYMAENIHLVGNLVKGGYDRAIHIESTYGGHFIEKNKFLGSDLAFVLVEPEISIDYKPVLIRDNLLSNVNFVRNSPYNKTYARTSFGDRALFFVLSKGGGDRKKLEFKNNKLLVDGNFVYDSNSILNNRSNSICFSRNIYQLVNMPFGALKIFNYAKANMSSERLTDGLTVTQ